MVTIEFTQKRGVMVKSILLKMNTITGGLLLYLQPEYHFAFQGESGIQAALFFPLISGIFFY
ncbi:hypothetical protein [Bacillus sp. T2.9-1]|uniref:hypothetical protein n=1 Tax=Bacillus sp. T2.9-1 TaxID=3041163 RepID=UPI0025409C94|nr:hypothetical protein [Bacillus sp. T2.9-1]